MDSTTSYFVGIDLSLNGTGLVILDNRENVIVKSLISSNPKTTKEERILYIWKNVESISKLKNLQKVYIEALSYGSHGQATLDLSGLHYYIRISFLLSDLNNYYKKYEVIPPTVLKKFVTGKGNCKKELMLLQIYKKWNIEFDNNNIADAYGLARLALENYRKGENNNVKS